MFLGKVTKFKKNLLLFLVMLKKPQEAQEEIPPVLIGLRYWIIGPTQKEPWTIQMLNKQIPELKIGARPRDLPRGYVGAWN